MSTSSLPPARLLAAVHGLKSVSPRRRIPVKITPYELRVAPADRRHGTYRYGRDKDTAVVILATSTSGSGTPRWMERAAGIIATTAHTLDDARAIVGDCYARRYRDRRPWRPESVAPASGVGPVDPGWLGDTPISPEETLRAAGIDDAWQATYQRKMSALLAGRAG